MLRALGNLTLVLCMARHAAFAGETDKVTREVSDHSQRVTEPVADAVADRMVTIELLIADLRRGEATMVDGKSPLTAKDYIQQLDKAGKLDSLTRVQLTTLNGQEASFHVGQRVGRITGSQRGPAGQINTVTMENVGLMLNIIPQIRGDGRVAMTIEIDHSQLGPTEEGTPIFIRSVRNDDQTLRPARSARGTGDPTFGAFDPNEARLRRPAVNAEGSNATLKPDDGETIRMAPTETVTARTTVIARSGQSVVVGSQLTKRQARQSELLIVVTPELLGKDAAPR